MNGGRCRATALQVMVLVTLSASQFRLSHKDHRRQSQPARSAQSVRPTSRSGCSIIAVEKRLQHHLSRDLVEPLLLFLAADLRLLQIQLSHRRRVSLVPVNNRQTTDLRRPLTKRSRFTSLRPFVAAHVNRQTDDQSNGLILGSDLLQERRVFRLVPSRVVFQRTGNRLIRRRNRDSKSLRAVIKSQQRAASRDSRDVIHGVVFQGLLNSRKWRDCITRF